MKMREAGQVYVTQAAARQYAEGAVSAYADGERPHHEESRRELTELAMEAHRVDEEDTKGLERWRFRRLSVGVDLTLRVLREPSLYEESATVMVVVSCNVRSRVRRTGKKR